MKRIVAYLLLLACCPVLFADVYVDHRGHDVDSLERVVAAWTPKMIDAAPDSLLNELVRNWQELMLGYLQINGPKSEYYARMILSVATPRRWRNSEFDAYKIIGQHFWASERYDSASVYYKKALDSISAMEAGETNSMTQEGYSQSAIDNAKSAMYGTIGNLYSMQDSIDTAMEYYEKAGEIFKRYGWLNSCAVLYYNMGETWGAVRDFPKAKECYEESLNYALEANDSLWIAGALKGFGAMYLEMGRTAKALNYLRKADNYYSVHEDEELRSRLETVDYIGQVLDLQKKSLKMQMLVSVMALLLAGAVVYAMRRLRKAKQEQKEVAVFIEETIAETPHVSDIKLNDREQSIIRMLAEGKDTAEMANTLCLSPETIKWYRKRLLAKFEVSSASALVAEAYRRGIL